MVRNSLPLGTGPGSTIPFDPTMDPRARQTLHDVDDLVRSGWPRSYAERARELCRSIAQLIACDVVSLSLVAQAGPRLWFSTDWPSVCTDGDLALISRELHSHPVVPLVVAGERGPFRTRDVAGFGDFRRGRLFHDFYQHHRLTEEVTVWSQDGGVRGALGVCRGATPFTDRDLDLLTALRPWLDTVLVRLRQLAVEEEPPPRAELTRREAQVLRALARGWTNAQIGRALDVSPLTVKRHVENLLAKISVPSRAALVAVASERGWL